MRVLLPAVDILKSCMADSLGDWGAHGSPRTGGAEG